MAQHKIIATAGDISTAGLIIWWTLRGHTDREEMQESIGAEGLTQFTAPPGPRPDTACIRALNEQRSGTRAKRRRLHRPLEGHAGRALVDETADDDALDYVVKATAKIGLAGRLVVECDDAELRTLIEDSYYEHLAGKLSTQDVSSWLSNHVVPQLDGLTLRDGGGFYFIPHIHVATWERVVAALKGCSNHTFASMSALHADNAVEAILGSMREEAAVLAQRSWDKIAKGEVGGRALESAAADAAAMREKVERYEVLLNVSATDMHESLTTLRAALAAAALKAHDGKDYKGLAGDLSWADEEV